MFNRAYTKFIKLHSHNFWIQIDEYQFVVSDVENFMNFRQLAYWKYIFFFHCIRSYLLYVKKQNMQNTKLLTKAHFMNFSQHYNIKKTFELHRKDP